MIITKSKKRFQCFLAVGCAVMALAGLLTLTPSLSASAEGEDGWTVVKRDGADVWKVNGDGTLSTLRSAEYDNNFLVRESDQAYGDYKVSAHFDVSENLATTSGAEIKLGLVPWYLDENNYITATVWWRNVDWTHSGDDKIANLLIYGKQDGHFLEIYNGSNFSQTEFSDFWVYNSVSYFSGEDQVALEQPMNIEKGWDFTVEKYHDVTMATGLDGDVLRLTLNGVVVGICTVNMTVPYRPSAPKVGVVSGNMATALTVSNFTVEDMANQELAGTDKAYELCEYNFNAVEGAPFGTVATGKKGGSWSYEAEVYTGDALNPEREDTVFQLIRPLPMMSGLDYTVSTTAKIAESGTESTVGLIAWYIDHNNYVYANVIVADGNVYACFSGMIAGEEVLSERSEAIESKGEDIKLTVEKVGAQLILSVNEERALAFSNAALYGKFGYAGLHVSNCIAKFTGLEIAGKTFEAFDEYLQTLDGAEYYLSSKTTEDFVYGGGKLTIDTSDFEHPAYAIAKAGIAQGVFKTTVSFAEGTVFGEGGSVGVMAYFESSEHYVYVVITRNSGSDIRAEIYEMADGSLEQIYSERISGIVLSDTLTLQTIVQNNAVSFYAEGKMLIDSFNVGNLPLAESVMAGIVAQNVQITAYLPVFEGFRANELYSLTDVYTARGISYDSWTVGNDGSVTGKAATGDLSGDIYGILWGNRALPYLCMQDITDAYCSDYYVYSKINVTKYDSVNTFHRVALIPWYLDDANFLYVAYSHVGTGSPDVGVFARINGTGYNNFTNIGGLASLLNTTLEMDVRIKGDLIEIYAGKSPLPIFSYTVSGMSAAINSALTSGKSLLAGSCVYALNATFSDFSVGTELSAVNTEKPEIVFLSNKTSRAQLNNTVTLPVVEVVDVTGELVNAVFTVLDPEGNEVTLINNARFVAETEGRYTITVNAENSWGVSADPIAWIVEVTPPQDGSSAVVIYVLLGVSVLLFCGSAVLLTLNIFKKKKSEISSEDTAENGAAEETKIK